MLKHLRCGMGSIKYEFLTRSKFSFTTMYYHQQRDVKMRPLFQQIKVHRPLIRFTLKMTIGGVHTKSFRIKFSVT